MVGNFVNKKRGRHGKKSRHPRKAGHTICCNITVDFMGAVFWHLGVCYKWSRTPGNRLFIHLSQKEAQAQKLLNKEQLIHCRPVSTPYCSGLPIDWMRHNGDMPEKMKALVKQCRSFMGCCVWPSTNTRPHITATVSLLLVSTHIQNPSGGYLQTPQVSLLKGSANWGMHFTHLSRPHCNQPVGVKT